MSKKMLVESDVHQTRIAILEDGLLTELFVERERARGLVGSVYKGRVTRVLPGMQAAFVNIGLDRDAFLYVNDVRESLDLIDAEGAEAGEATRGNGRSPANSLPIEELLREGQELLVQVIKDPLPNKGARISSHITLPGRYLVLLPSSSGIAISRRIESAEERQRLLATVEPLVPPEVGLIVRTVGEGKGPEEFEADLAYLLRRWQQLEQRSLRAGAPSLLHQDLDPVLRVVRDVFTGEYQSMLVHGRETSERIRSFLREVQPALVERVAEDEGERPLFQRYRIDEEMENALKSRVWLKSGGYLVIHPTEALVAIDVNTGRFVGEHDLEETVLCTNLEAIREVVRQIRLRDLGGIIVLDLIDMIRPEHQQRVLAALEEELRKDRAKNKMLSISEFGLVELTRKRTRPSLERLLTQPCPYCKGRGRIKSLTTICLNLRQRLLERRPSPAGKDSAGKDSAKKIHLRLHPDVGRALKEEERSILEELEQKLGAQLVLQSDPTLHHERIEIDEI